MTQATVTQLQTLHLIAGVEVPGAPTLRLSLLYNPDTRTLDGTGVITQAVTPPGGRIDVRGIQGEVAGLSTGPRLITLRGSAFEPPMMVVFPFSAAFVVDNDWKGEGSFAYGMKVVTAVPIRLERLGQD